jgi:hypothetical protein
MDREPTLSRTETAGPNEPVIVDASAVPPVVARCVVEVRSDGTVSMARGVFEVEDERVVIEGIGRTPRELLAMLARGTFAHARMRISDARHKLEQRLPPLLLAKRIARQA